MFCIGRVEDSALLDSHLHLLSLALCGEINNCIPGSHSLLKITLISQKLSFTAIHMRDDSFILHAEAGVFMRACMRVHLEPQISTSGHFSFIVYTYGQHLHFMQVCLIISISSWASYTHTHTQAYVLFFYPYEDQRSSELFL